MIFPPRWGLPSLEALSNWAPVSPLPPELLPPLLLLLPPPPPPPQAAAIDRDARADGHGPQPPVLTLAPARRVPVRFPHVFAPLSVRAAKP